MFPVTTIFLTGCTASGKTSLGISLAERLGGGVGGEILSVDSMAVYRGMDIGTAKPLLHERRGIPHHLIDLVSPREEFSLSDYLQAAEIAERDILARGKVAIYVGGTPLYLKGLICGFAEVPRGDENFRAATLAHAANESRDFLHNQLAKIDAPSAARLHPNDTRRILRALEVFQQTGIPLSAQQQEFQTVRRNEPIFVLHWSREILRARIAERVTTLLELGWLEEVAQLYNANLCNSDFATQVLSKTAAQAVGYRELLAVLRGEMTLENATAQIITRTHQFAKRQMTWFRSLPNTVFLDAEKEDLLFLSSQQITPQSV